MTDIDGSLAVQWGLLKPAPDSVSEFVSCRCKRSECAWNHCSCAADKLPCTDLCDCTSCKYKDSLKQVDIYEIFHDNYDFGEYKDEDTNGEADDSSDSKDDLFANDEIDKD